MLPYSEYLLKSGNKQEDEKRARWLEEIKMTLFDVGEQDTNCLLYTSDAADDLLCVDLGGRRIIKKKNTKKKKKKEK